MNDNISNPIIKLLDPIHQQAQPFELEMSHNLWTEKYRWGSEPTFNYTCERVANAIMGHDSPKHGQEALYFMEAGLWMPAGRIWAGAGTEKRVTLINCFVNEVLEDSMEGIMRGLSNTALTMQQGGGMGTDFSCLRPSGAVLKRTHTRASGPLPFMDMWDGMSRTIRSAGDRRGAMMGTISDTHPDLPHFIKAKRKKGRLEEFNVSVLISEAFMDALDVDEDWVLHFAIPPMFRQKDMEEHDFTDEDGIKQFAYSVWKARDLWKMITENTYEFSEPGIIFIDRVNQLNNLQHVEEIRCTNPCGEQPLPPHGACDLGHVNVSRLVRYPFTDKAEFDWQLLRRAATIGQRFLDNVLDVTNFPLPEQKGESDFKRRTGLGITGLADAMAQMVLRYGSPRSMEFAENVMREVCLASYETNVDLAIEKGPCSAASPKGLMPIPGGYKDSDNAELICSGTTFVNQRLPRELKERIKNHGLRNGVALTVAPTGTVSATFWNIGGSGCEPPFAHEYDRKVRVSKDGEPDAYKTYNRVSGYAHRLWKKVHGPDSDYPPYMVTAQDLSVEDHITIQAAVQRWVDASVSKTVNCPKEISYEDFVKVYDLAYQLGCKGCTTYRPSETRGSILSVGEENAPAKDPTRSTKRPEILNGCTYQIKWPKREAALYLTLNHDDDGRPAEVLVSSKDTSSFEWVTALTLMMTAIFKKGGDVKFVADELKQVQSVDNASWVDGKFYGSLVSYIGHVLQRHFNGTSDERPMKPMMSQPVGMRPGEICPQCKAPTVIREEGCKKCTNCNWSNCG